MAEIREASALEHCEGAERNLLALEVTPGWRNWQDAPRLKRGAERHVGSNPAPGTKDLRSIPH